MSAEQSQQIKALFDDAFDLAPNDRERFLVEACAGDDSLFAAVQKLLLLAADAPDFLEAPPLINELPDPSSASHSDALIERRIGAYKIIRELGRGGMGTVFLAHRADQTFEKQVAIKLVWPGLGSEEILLRFQQERQILARLEHPNIARLLDGGVTEDGWHYIVMEYIEGVSITQFCGGNLLSIDARLNLFRAVCEAVQFAHQNLVIHRDLKPGNILVTADGAPKLLDFGIAKLLETNEASLALTHTQLPMTPEYASPEQLQNQPITTVTEVYSLGVVLYEILTRRKPYHFKMPLLHEIARVVTEDEPDNPNLDDDLDNIVLKAMRKEPLQRYQSIEQFSADIGRYLEGKTVLARKATTGYRVGKFVRRYKTSVALAGLLILTLVTVAIISVWQASIARDQARTQRRTLYAVQMNQALQDWEIGNLTRMRETLDSWLPQASLVGQEDLRGFEWNYLWRLRHPETVTIKLPIATEDGGIAFYDQGNFVAIADQTAFRLWDAKTGQALNTIERAAYSTTHLVRTENGFPVLLADGKTVQIKNLRTGELRQAINTPHQSATFFGSQFDQVVTGHDDGIIRFWNIATGQWRASIPCQTAPVDVLSFSLDYQKAITRPAAQTWQLLDLTNRSKLTVKAETAAAYPVFSSDNQYFFLQEGNELTRVFSAVTGQELKRLAVPGERILFASFSPDARHLLVTSTDNAARLYRLPSLEQVAIFQSNGGWMRSAFISPDEKYLVASCSDRTAKLWEMATQKEIAVIKGHEGRVHSAVFSYDGRKVMTWSEDGTARIWEMAELLRPDQLSGHTDHIFSVAYAPDGKTLATASQDRSIKLWDAVTGQCVRTLNGHTNWVFAVAFAPDGKTLASGSQDHSLRLWDVATGQEIRRFTGHTEPVRAVAFAPDEKRLATASSDASVRVWDVASGRELMKLSGHKGETYSVAFSADGGQLLSAGHDKTARLWDAKTGQEIKQLSGHTDAVWAAKFSSDGRLIATSSADRTIKLWDASTGRETATMRGHANDIFSLAWSPDGTRIASASNDKTVRLWSVKLGLEVLTLRQHNEQVWSVAFAPDGNTLASGSWDKTVRLWRASPAKLTP